MHQGASCAYGSRSPFCPSAFTLALHAQSTTTAEPKPALTYTRTRACPARRGRTDNKQNPIGGLKASDFTVLEKGKPQTILHFDEHAPLPPGKPSPLPRLPSNTFTNYTPLPENQPLNILLLDALNTPMKDQAYVRYQMLKFLGQYAARLRALPVFGLTTHLRILQGFTSGPRDPSRRTEWQEEFLPQSSVLLNDPVSGDYPGSEASAFGTPDFGEVSANVQQFQSEIQSFQLQMRARYTLDGMNDLARYLAGIPGRKNLIWFSGSFPLDISQRRPGRSVRRHGFGGR